MQALIKTADQIKGIKKACRLASRVLDEVGYLVAEGISTETLDKFIHDFIVKHNGIPATLNYKGYPKSCCISRNDVICHGIPRDDEILQNGDIVNIDVTVILDGYFGDTSRMYCVGGIGSISSTARRLVEVTEAALYQGIKVVRNGGYVNDIGVSIESFVDSTGSGFQIVKEFTGHGIGLEFHEPPQVRHFNTGQAGMKLRSGMVLTIEPMINEGHWKSKTEADGWTVRTIDGSLSAQWEHTVVVLDNGCEILTIS